MDLIDISLLSLKVKSVWLSVTDESDNRAILDDFSSELFSLFIIRLETLLILRESSSLGLEPILIKSSLERILKRTGKDRGQSSESSKGLNISNHTNDSHWWSLNDSDWLNLFLLVQKRSSSGILSDNMGHSGLDSSKGSQVASDSLDILREGSDSSRVMSGSSFGKESEVTFSWFLKLSMRHAL